MHPPPFRFGLSKSTAATRRELGAAARRAEAVGYSSLVAADHLGILAPFTAAAVAACATERIRVGPFVLNNDFWHPALMAREAATLDLLSDGRLELGMGAGHMKTEYEAIGLAFHPAWERIERLAESVRLVKRLLSGERVTYRGRFYQLEQHQLSPLPPQGSSLPVLIGGNGDRLLAVAAREADIVGFSGFLPGRDGTDPSPTHFTSAGLSDRIDHVRREAGERFSELELNVLVQRVVVTSDRRSAAQHLSVSWPPAQEILDSPFVLLGTVEEIIDQLQEHRERLGVSYWVVFEGRSEGFDQVVERLAGT
ncbi:MAG: TIGR03621 family F420-dependent LLM class oxidoreductase [Actinomycetota bacterium]|nr:TIGR03621 family F420-dependent LLM class oxidoreductase [Actinomycetota bacterium]